MYVTNAEESPMTKGKQPHRSRRTSLDVESIHSAKQQPKGKSDHPCKVWLLADAVYEVPKGNLAVEKRIWKLTPFHEIKRGDRFKREIHGTVWTALYDCEHGFVAARRWGGDFLPAIRGVIAGLSMSSNDMW
jgi:hypothetical protein